MKGRILQCSGCSRPTCKGTTQVFRRIVFHFCLACWLDRRAACNDWMWRVAS